MSSGHLLDGLREHRHDLRHLIGFPFSRSIIDRCSCTGWGMERLSNPARAAWMAAGSG